MTYRITKLTVALCAAFTMALAVGGCKEDTIISSNVTPAIDNITTFQVTLPDSFYTAKTVRDDSIVTSSSTTSIYQALGRVEDGIANTTGSVYLQFVPKSTGTKLPTGEVLDSAFVILPYSGFTWGDTINTSSYTINAYRITDTLSVGTSYFPFTKKTTETAIAGTGTFRIGPKGTGVLADSVSVGGTKVAPHLRVKLNSNIINDVQTINDSTTTFAGFINNFRGIYLVPDTVTGGKKALPYFLVDGAVSNYSGANLLIYSHNVARTKQDTTFSFPYNPTYNARYNRISRVFDESIFNAGNQYLTVQNQPGAAIDFQFKSLDKQNLVPAGSVINKVEIIFTKKNDPASDPYFFGPNRIYPQAISTTGVRYTILDRYPTTSQDGLNFIDGTPRDSAGTVKYTLNVPREFQLAITTGQSALHLLIGGTINFPGAYRLRLGSMSHPDPTYRPLVKIIYSKQK